MKHDVFVAGRSPHRRCSRRSVLHVFLPCQREPGIEHVLARPCHMFGIHLPDENERRPVVKMLHLQVRLFTACHRSRTVSTITSLTFCSSARLISCELSVPSLRPAIRSCSLPIVSSGCSVPRPASPASPRSRRRSCRRRWSRLWSCRPAGLRHARRRSPHPLHRSRGSACRHWR
jgi:hypothetical protein